MSIPEPSGPYDDLTPDQRARLRGTVLLFWPSHDDDPVMTLHAPGKWFTPETAAELRRILVRHADVMSRPSPEPSAACEGIAKDAAEFVNATHTLRCLALPTPDLALNDCPACRLRTEERAFYLIHGLRALLSESERLWEGERLNSAQIHTSCHAERDELAARLAESEREATSVDASRREICRLREQLRELNVERFKDQTRAVGARYEVICAAEDLRIDLQRSVAREARLSWLAWGMLAEMEKIAALGKREGLVVHPDFAKLIERARAVLAESGAPK